MQQQLRILKCACARYTYIPEVTTLVKLCEIQNIMLYFECYSSFFKFLQADCPNSDNDDVYLSWNCTPSKNVLYDHQHKGWQNLKHEILSKEDHDVHINFQYFITKETEKNGITKKRLVAESRSVNLSFIIDFIDDLLPKIVHHRNLLSNYRSAYPKVLQSLSTAEISIDFSENLVLTLPQEIQSMYWGQAKTSVTVHSCLVKYEGKKQYHPYFSDDLTHDQCFAYASIIKIIDDIDIDPGSTLIILGTTAAANTSLPKISLI